MNCARCGFPAMPVYDKKRGWQAACTRCGAMEGIDAVEGLSIEVAQNASRAWNCYRIQKFDKAQEFLSEIVQRSDCRPEYMWFELLVEYGVKYCETNAGQYAVNFWRRELPEGALSKQAGYQRLQEEAAYDLDELRSYERAAEDIDRGLRQISETQKDAYDVFLCFKDRDAAGGTPERELCEGLYSELLSRGMRVFYAPKTLNGKFTTDYEGYIHSALKNAEVLLIVTSSGENVRSTWVKSEWRRFQQWNAGEDRRLMTCMVGEMTPQDFPEELSSYQHDLKVEMKNLREPNTFKYLSLAVAERCRSVRKDGREQSVTRREAARGAGSKAGEPRPLSEQERLAARAQGGDAEAQLELGKRYAEGEGVSQDYVEAVNWYRKAAERGDAAAQYGLGDCYYYGQGVSQDYVEAVKWYRKAAEQGNAAAWFKLGLCYANGQGVSQDYGEAVKWYRKAAEQGNAAAQCNLGWCYDNGKGVPQDDTEAVKWYLKAAEQGDDAAQNNLAWCYDKGQGVEQDCDEAVKWFRKAVEQGNANAQYGLGNCYFKGQGVPQDYAEAAKWYRKAAEQGNAVAQFNLGVCYANGHGVKQDCAEAAKWYRKSAEQGYASAQYNLGNSYYNGQGVSQDYAEAEKWYGKSAEQGHARAGEMMKKAQKQRRRRFW